MFSRIVWLGLFLIFITLWACAPKPAAILPEVKSETEVAAPGAKEAWELEWEKTLAEAKKEGKVVIYTSRGPEARQALIDGFKKRTGLDLAMVSGRSTEIIAKWRQETRAGLYLVDAIISAPSSILATEGLKKDLRPLTPELFLPEVVDTSLWYKGKLPFIDRENNLILQTRLHPGGEVDAVYNTTLTSKGELVFWRDVLKPQFKGKMNMADPTSGKGFMFIRKAITSYGLDWDYIRDLVRQEPLITRDERLQVEWVARGKHVVGLHPDGKMIDTFQREGAPVDWVTFKDTIPSMGAGSFAIALPHKSAHPNAAKIFTNWFLSKEGQTIFSRATLYQSAREDVPTDHLMKGRIRQPGVDYFIEDEEWMERGQELLPKALEIFGPLLR